MVFCRERTVAQTVEFQCLSRSSLISESHRGLRRRYGIPDVDRRTFDTAYDDAQRFVGPEDSAEQEAERTRKEAEMAQKLAERLETYKFNFGALVLDFCTAISTLTPTQMLPTMQGSPLRGSPAFRKKKKNYLSKTQNY